MAITLHRLDSLGAQPDSNTEECRWRGALENLSHVSHHGFIRSQHSRDTATFAAATAYIEHVAQKDTKNAADHDGSPPRTPTGNAPSSESDIDISSPNMSHDESIAKDMSMKDSGSDLSQRPKRRRFHESYNFNMKCPTPGCNSLGHLTGKHERHFSISGCPLYHNLSADECKVRAQSRDKQVEERMLSHRQDDNRQATRHQDTIPLTCITSELTEVKMVLEAL
ncbi:histone acetyltransferase KAT7-like [Crotalus adamanteus]|uniref:Histone acetyltransferase KAT7-like n=1 Tax=Crotalus adamanteus TaxID=8729 RepID=A0AAW1B0G4_CROAD